MNSTVTHLLVKHARKQPLSSVDRIQFTSVGICRNVRCSPLRQVLTVPRRVLADLHLDPGDLRENMVVDLDELHDLPSGTVLQIGDAQIRLTFHCEPCRRMARLAPIANLLHRRGVLGVFLDVGEVRVGDAVRIAARFFEAIPYAVPDRIRWYLDRQTEAISARNLLHKLGIHNSYARALPAMLRNLPPSYRSLVRFGSPNEKPVFRRV